MCRRVQRTHTHSHTHFLSKCLQLLELECNREATIDVCVAFGWKQFDLIEHMLFTSIKCQISFRFVVVALLFSFLTINVLVSNYFIYFLSWYIPRPTVMFGSVNISLSLVDRNKQVMTFQSSVPEAKIMLRILFSCALHFWNLSKRTTDYVWIEHQTFSFPHLQWRPGVKVATTSSFWSGR